MPSSRSFRLQCSTFDRTKATFLQPRASGASELKMDSMEGFLRKKPLDGHFGRTLTRRFVAYDRKLDWYDPRARPGALPKGSLDLTPDTRVDRQGTDTIIIRANGHALVLMGEELERWATAITAQACGKSRPPARPISHSPPPPAQSVAQCHHAPRPTPHAQQPITAGSGGGQAYAGTHRTQAPAHGEIAVNSPRSHPHTRLCHIPTGSFDACALVWVVGLMVLAQGDDDRALAVYAARVARVRTDHVR